MRGECRGRATVHHQDNVFCRCTGQANKASYGHGDSGVVRLPTPYAPSAIFRVYLSVLSVLSTALHNHSRAHHMRASRRAPPTPAA